MFTLKSESTDYAFTDACRDYYGTITCNVTLAETGEVISFTASPDDAEEYGRVLYEQLNTTDLASVAPFTDEARATQDAYLARLKRNTLLSNTDWTQTNDVPEATKTAWTTYRQELRDISLQAGFPSTITWPTAP
jgi:hypothetical protein